MTTPSQELLAPLKTELVDATHDPTRDAAMASSGDYLERFYNHARRYSYLGYSRPVEFESRTRTWPRLMHSRLVYQSEKEHHSLFRATSSPHVQTTHTARRCCSIPPGSAA
ncbi:IS3 family transposase [Polyangium jinanense]|uniref:IS3 family transposase n=1 Tax=Polyangium jinanense TaxID=2829994 RepID=UPI00355A6DFF